jgi:mannose-1-phosphate guanylyltransferase
MKAMLLAGGLGTRLKSITKDTPKCMVNVQGKPVLEHNIEWIKKFGITEFLINLHHLPEIVMDYFGNGSRWDININYSVETEPMGTAGGVKLLEDKLEETFLVWYGDNLSNCKLDHLIDFHRKNNGVGSMALFNRDDETACRSGIALLRDDGLIEGYLEKPKPEELTTHLIGAGIIIFEPSVFKYIKSGVFQDFGKDIFPRLTNKLYGYKMDSSEGLWWMDTEEDLQRCERVLYTKESMNGNIS